MINGAGRYALGAVLCCAFLSLSILTVTAQMGERMLLAHNVYFSLKDASDAAKARLVDACHNHLKDHPGQVFFAAGMLAGDMSREVNDRDFDVALHIVFRGRADHDRYQVNDRHKRFIEENQANWARVRVFDSYVK